MKFNFKKYIACVILLVILIGVASLSYATVDGSSTFPSVPIIEIEEDDEEETDANPNDGTNQPVVVPVFTDGISCANYAISKLKEGAGYEDHCYISCESSVLGITAYQYIYSHRQNNQKVTYEEILTQCEVSVGENYFKYQYIDKGNNLYGTRKTTNKNGVDAVFKDNEVEENRPMDEFLAEQPSTFETFPFIISNATTKCKSFSVVTEKNKEYYLMKLELSYDAIKKSYFDMIKFNANATEFNWASTTLTLKINKKTLKIVTAEQNEKYGMRARGFYLNINQTASYTFTKVDVNFDIASKYKNFN